MTSTTDQRDQASCHITSVADSKEKAAETMSQTICEQEVKLSQSLLSSNTVTPPVSCVINSSNQSTKQNLEGEVMSQMISHDADGLVQSKDENFDAMVAVNEVEVWKIRSPHMSVKTNSTPSSGQQSQLKSSTSSESPQTSEQLLNFAKKLIEDQGLGKTITISTAEDSKCIIRSDPEKSKATSGSDSVITMYLSSPNELKEKLEKLNTNSPVIVMQAGEDLLSIKKELSSESDSSTRGESGEQVIITSTGVSVSNSSDSIVAALSSLTSKPVLYRCVECDYSSHNKHYYKQHVDLVHNTERPHKCPLCDYAGKRKHALLEHMVVHSNERPFICEHCNASFRKKGHLTNHIKLHTSQRLVQCSICQIQLPDSEAFEAHLHKIHNTDRLYKCRICDLTLVDRDSMLKHLLSHSAPGNPVQGLQTAGNITVKAKESSEVLDEKRVLHGKTLPVEIKNSVAPSNVSVFDKGKVENQPIQVTANIVCSVCGFICMDRNVMKGHMWEHLKKTPVATMPLQEKNVGKAEEATTMSVLKRNVNSGQKSLPDNVTYQCAACSFTSNDNSVFIKHMLAHKTQQKKQQVEINPSSSEAAKTQNSVVITTLPNAKTTQEVKVSYTSEAKPVKESSETDAPFIYDKTAGRYRCVICGYHCEFQRTIKAHIWKHSGHKSIQYPMFDATSTPPAASGKRVMTEGASEQTRQDGGQRADTGMIDMGKTLTGVPVLKTPTGELVPLMPLESMKTNYDPKNIVQVKNNAVVVSANLDKPPSASKLIESMNIAVTESTSKTLSGVSTISVLPSPTVSKSIVIKEPILVTKPKMSPQELSVVKAIPENRVPVSTSEPGVVVEIVDSVPTSLGLTGLKSQQGSPRISDLDGSGSEANLIKLFNEARQTSRDSTEDDKVEAPVKKEEIKQVRVIMPEDIAPKVVVERVMKTCTSPPVRLRCPKCDCLLLGKDELTSHLLACTVGEQKTESVEEEIEDKIATTEPPSSEKIGSDQDDQLATEDSDATASSDEQGNTGDSNASGSQQKTGICSSLLAVIEQLRERSQSESDDCKPVSLSTRSGGTGGRKRLRQRSDMSDLSPDDVQNIEKISDKYRCKLCHYTSQRICNMKLHMKTHRQKKPSECSLCDFSSDSPEALQDHMLKHCKVRTYACKFCPQTFNHKSTLRAHLRAHKDQEPFLCAYCVFETTSPIEYREHMQVHSGCSSRLRCPLCDKISSNKEELTSHLMKCKGSRASEKPEQDSEKGENVESQDGQKSSQPNVPGASASSTSSHHACVVKGCTFSCNNLKELQEHLSVHSNPSLLLCNLCDFKAWHSRSLKSHMKRHANDQRYVQQPLEQYKCNLCGYVCHHLPSLKSHMWRHASDQSYSYEFTNDVINAAIDYDTRLDMNGDVDDPELLDRVISSERKIMEGELTNRNQGDGQRPICWVTFRCCSCGFETINKPKLNIHMRSHSDIIQQALDVPRKGVQIQARPGGKTGEKHSISVSSEQPFVPIKVMKT